MLKFVELVDKKSIKLFSNDYTDGFIYLNEKAWEELKENIDNELAKHIKVETVTTKYASFSALLEMLRVRDMDKLRMALCYSYFSDDATTAMWSRKELIDLYVDYHKSDKTQDVKQVAVAIVDLLETLLPDVYEIHFRVDHR